MTAWLLLISIAAPNVATVAYVSSERAYFDRGASSGLVAGTIVSSSSGASCTIDQAARSHASCRSTTFRPQERITFQAAAPRETAARAASSTVGPARIELDATAIGEIRSALDRAPQPLIETRTLEAPLRPIRATAFAGVAAWAHADRAPFLHERVDLAISELELGVLGLRGDLELTAIAWNLRPVGARFRPKSGAHLYVHALSVHAREDGRRFTQSAGRIRPSSAPGLYVLDGVQLGYRPELIDGELGLIAGAPPDVATLEPQTKRWLSSAYWRIASTIGELVWWHEGRAGFARGAENFGELEAAIAVSHAELRANAGARATVDQSGAALPGAHASVAADLFERTVGLVIEGRTRSAEHGLYEGYEAADYASASVRYRGLRQIELGAGGGLARMSEAAIAREFAGVEILFAGVFGGVAGLFYQESFGALPGRAVHAQLYFAPIDGATLFARTSYLEDRFAAGTARDLALQAGLELPLVFGLRLESNLRAQYDLRGPSADQGAFGLALRAGLAGEL